MPLRLNLYVYSVILVSFHLIQVLPLGVLDVAVEASHRLSTVKIIVALEAACNFVKFCLNTSLVTTSVRLAGHPWEVGDMGHGGDRHPTGINLSYYIRTCGL